MDSLVLFSELYLDKSELECDLLIIEQNNIDFYKAKYHIVKNLKDGSAINQPIHTLYIIDATMQSYLKHNSSAESLLKLPFISMSTVCTDFSFRMLFGALNVYNMKGIEIKDPILKILIYKFYKNAYHISGPIGEVNCSMALTAGLVNTDVLAHRQFKCFRELWPRITNSMKCFIPFFNSISTYDGRCAILIRFLETTNFDRNANIFILNAIKYIEDLFYIPVIVWKITDCIKIEKDNSLKKLFFEPTDAELFLYRVLDVVIENQFENSCILFMAFNLLATRAYQLSDNTSCMSDISDISEYELHHMQFNNMFDEEVTMFRRFQKLAFYFHKYMNHKFSEDDIDSMIADLKNLSKLHIHHHFYTNFKIAFIEYIKVRDDVLNAP